LRHNGEIVGTTVRLRAHVRDELARHGLAPLATTSPEQLRDAVRDLYRYEIRRLRSDLLAGHIVRRDYAARVIDLRRRYPLLSVPLSLWLEPTGDE
jgi:hypothetical protein